MVISIKKLKLQFVFVSKIKILKITQKIYVFSGIVENLIC